MKRRRRTMMDDTLMLGKSALVTGVMGTAVTRAGGDASGLNAMSQFFPAMGSTMGGGHTLGMLMDLGKKKMKRRGLL